MKNKNFIKMQQIARNNDYELVYIDRYEPTLALINMNTSECNMWKMEDAVETGFYRVAQHLLENALNEQFVKSVVDRMDYFDTMTLHSVVEVLSDNLFLVDVIEGFYTLRDEDGEV